MSRDISWINEIKNNTEEDYIIWCHDTDNEGEYRDFVTDEPVGKNDGGKQVIIKAGAHLVAGGCGIPDGGDKDGKPKARVICAYSAAQRHSGDPGAGLRINRVMGDNDQDKIVYRDHYTTKQLAEIIFPRGMEQNIILRIDADGIYLDIKEAKTSSEWQAYVFGQKLKDFFEELAPELAKLAIQAAQKALEAV
ncbi:hypothetical protein [Dyadobacter jiangsuensis]|uniref:Uncharacterized protein n=1 Tax=Dyadobacter jiangsuensis TaxID=1591085 RepID=A0A2P8GBH2_9BACT|nr:hypothetical protein [Dyadobacter jiangsuensis]PSL31320.1 hypothetical protein CLV60_103186 [Dyadobacter jiangsuensis]